MITKESVHIIVIEDDIVDIEGIKRAFKKHRITNPVHFVKDGLEALNSLQGTNGYTKLQPTPKIMLLDLNLPKMHGLELLEKIRQDPELKSIIVFILTTSDNDNDINLAYNFNVAGYILKPFASVDFFTAISKLSFFWNLIEYDKDQH